MRDKKQVNNPLGWVPPEADLKETTWTCAHDRIFPSLRWIIPKAEINRFANLNLMGLGIASAQKKLEQTTRT